MRAKATTVRHVPVTLPPEAHPAQLCAQKPLRAQDLVFVVQQEDHPTLQRDGDDLIIGVRISLADALTDSKIDIPFLGGRTLRVPLREVHPLSARLS